MPARAGEGKGQQGTSPQQGYKARFENWSMRLLELFPGAGSGDLASAYDQRRHHFPPPSVSRPSVAFLFLLFVRGLPLIFFSPSPCLVGITEESGNHNYRHFLPVLSCFP